MINTKKYVYSLFGNFKNFIKLRNMAGEIPSVVDAELDEKANTLTLMIDEQASEYDVYCTLNEIAESLSIDIDYADDSAEERDASDQSAIDRSDDPQTDSSVQDEEEVQEEQKAPVFEKKVVPDDQKPWKSRYIGNFVEIAISLVLILVATIFKLSGNFGMIMYLLAFAVVGYEIIWDGVTAVLKKNYFNYNIPIVVATVISLFVTSYREAAVVALIFETLIVLGKVVRDVVGSKIKERLYYNYKIIKQGEGDDEFQVFAHEVREGAVVTVKEGEIVPFDCTVESGEAIFDSFNITGISKKTVKTVGQTVYGGERVTSGLANVVVKNTVEKSVAGKLYNKLTEDGTETTAKVKKLSDRITVISLLVGVIVCFIVPLFEMSTIGYAEGLAKWAYVAIMLFALSNSFAVTLAREITVISGLNHALSINSFILSQDQFEDIALADTVTFVEPNAISCGEVKIFKVSAVPQYKGKLTKIISATGAGAEELIKEKFIGEANGRAVVVGVFSEICKLCNNVKESSLEGEVRYVVVDGEFAGAISIVKGLKANAKGVVRELRDASVKAVIAAEGDLSEFNDVANIATVKELHDATVETGVVYAGVSGELSDAIADIKYCKDVEAFDKDYTVVITSDDVKPVAKLVKLAKRQVKKSKQNFVISLVIKAVALAVGVVLALFTAVPSFWIAVAIGCVAD
ncbi:MAG: hypothetical protein IKC36_02690, partial [Clostridia bacterium]|nr:hypothetical protein [Clostridia bacterium]